MFSPPLLSLHSSLLLQIPPLFFNTQPPKHKTQFQNNRTDNKAHYLSWFSTKTPSYSGTHVPNSHGNQDTTIFDNNVASCSDNQSTRNRLLDDYELLGHLIQSCTCTTELKRIHAVVLKSMKIDTTYVNNNLISGYLRLGCLEDARQVFDETSEKNVVSWTCMINGYVKFGFDNEALRLFSEFLASGDKGNAKTFTCVLNLCSKRLDFELGKQVHGCVIKGGLNGMILESGISYLYARCGDLEGAFQVFDRMKKRDVVCWTTMITACSQHGRGGDALVLFLRMVREGFEANEYTVCSVLNACGEEKELRFGKQLHGAVVKKVYRTDVFVGTSLVDMYAKCGEVEDSRLVFDGMRKRNTVTWTSIIAGYARNSLGEEAISLFRVMKRRKICANNLTMVSILRACGLLRALPTGKEVHAQIIKNFVQSNIYIGSALVWLYCKCGEYSAASKVLQDMPLRDVVSWTAMISGCARLGHEYEALEYLKEMLGEGVDPNPFTYSSALKACARLEDVEQGKLLHSSINKTPALSNVFVGSALINMYAKCGHLPEAIQVFDSMPEKNLVSWKAMIVAYAKNGLCGEALKLMYRMQAEGIEVDDYILSTVLTACGDLEWKRSSKSEHYVQSSRHLT